MSRTALSVRIEGEEIRVPDWVSDLESFRRWTDHDDFPEHGRIAYLCGEVWIDMSKEQLFTHNRVKTTCTTVVNTLVEAEDLGVYFTDGAFVSNEVGDISNQPDGMFVSTASLAANRVRFIEGKDEGLVEVEGSPDMVLEVVSRSSVTKDTVTLRAAYAAAGIPEYWLIDARAEAVRFEVLVLTGDGYRVTRRRAGWIRSNVFRRWFRLVQAAGDDGQPEFTLEHRTERP